VALAQVDPTVGDLESNAALIERFHARAVEAGADVVAFPELALSGYPPEDLVYDRSFVDANLAGIKALAGSLRGAASIVGFVGRNGQDAPTNAAAVLAGGRVRGIYDKIELPNYGVFDEKRHFAPGARTPLFVVRGVAIGVTICEDAWRGDGPVHRCARLGAEAVVNVNASPYHRGKTFERQVLMRQRALDDRVAMLYVQTVGGQDELVFDGDSLAYGPDGKLLARGSQFEEDLVLVDLTFPARRRAIARTAEVVRISQPLKRPSRPALRARQPRTASSPTEEVYTALLIGTRDYVRKNGFTRAFVGLSGGIDSSLTAVVAADAIGAEHVTGIAMPSRYSSIASLEDAKELATNLGIDFHVVPIDGVFDRFLEAFAEPMAGGAPAVAEENTQARIRGTILMALSNAFPRSLVLTTGNKSELAVGYSTLYGDMAGGFAVIKDVPKTLVYELASWRNAYGIAAIPERAFTKPPSAELRPDQRDTDSLPPYDVLDPILELYVERRAPVEEILAAGHPAGVVRRVVAMVDSSEYKRRQAPPGVKISPLAFGRDRRLPITNHFRSPEGRTAR